MTLDEFVALARDQGLVLNLHVDFREKNVHVSGVKVTKTRVGNEKSASAASPDWAVQEVIRKLRMI
jgi:hypothetical protein